MMILNEQDRESCGRAGGQVIPSAAKEPTRVQRLNDARRMRAARIRAGALDDTGQAFPIVIVHTHHRAATNFEYHTNTHTVNADSSESRAM